MIAPLKRLLEYLAVGSGFTRIGRRLHRHDAMIVAFHNVVPDDEPSVGDRSLHLPLRKFSAFLDELAVDYDVVSLEALLPSPRSTPSRPRVAITFDDAYRGAVTLGVRELETRGLPATIFVSPAFVGDGEFWWDVFAETMRPTEFDELRVHALTELGGEDKLIRRWAAKRGIEAGSMPSYARVATEGELEIAVTVPGIKLGSHTWSHPNLARLSPNRVIEELTRSHDWLRERFEQTTTWLSYPYGSTSPIVQELARDTGFSAALRIEGGWSRPPLRGNYATPRLNIPAGLSTFGFALRAAGF